MSDFLRLFIDEPLLRALLLITAIWGINFSVIKMGLEDIDPFILAGIRFLLCALPALFFIPGPEVKWRWLIGYGLVFGVGLWGMGIKLGLSAGGGVTAAAIQRTVYPVTGKLDVS